MISFLLGDYGCGKSNYIFEKIKADYNEGVHSLLIVPEQESLVCERKLALNLPPRAQLFCEVVNFTRLANKVFREFGGLKYNYITKSAKNLVMYKALCECRDALSEYSIAKGHEKGYVSLFLHAISEMKTYLVDISMLEDIKKDIENERLRHRIEDIVRVWSSYERIMSERFSDPLDDLALLAKTLDCVDYFKDTNVYIDSFYGFTSNQFDVLARVLKGAKNVTLAFDCPRDALGGKMQYQKLAKTVNDLFNMCKRHGLEYTVLSFDIDYKHKNDDMKFVSSNLWNFSCERKKNVESISTFLCGDEFEESELVASRIRALIEKGYKYSEIAIISRNSSTYRGILDYTLKKYDIPYFFSTPSVLMSRPIMRMVFFALNALSGYKSEDIIGYIKCGYVDAPDSDIGEFERYVTRWGISGRKFFDDDYWASNPDGYVGEMNEGQKKTHETILKLRDTVLNKLSIIKKPKEGEKTVRELARALFDFLCAHDVVKRLEEEKRCADKGEAYIIVQVWDALLSSLDTLVDICGSDYVDINTFTILLSYALLECDLGTIPTGDDNVLIADASMVRAENVRHVFVLGANEGAFPASVSDSSFFSDTDKITLESCGINLSEKSDMRADDELMFFSRSLAIASEGATVSSLYSSIRGEKKQSSIAFERLHQILDIKAENFSSIKLIDRIYTEQTAKEYLGASSGALEYALCEVLGTEPSASSFSNEKMMVSSELCSEIFGDEIRLTQSAIERFQLCHLSYFSQYFLKLRSNQKFSFASREAGTMFHAVFEYILTMLKNRKIDFDTLADDELETLVISLANDYITKILGGARLTSRLSHLIDRMKSNLIVVTKRIVEEFIQSDFEPAYFELSFNGDGVSTPLPFELETKNGQKITLYGTADRVDLYRLGRTTYIRIVDYKLGSKHFSLDEFREGTELQLLIYLFALCKMKDCKFKRELLKDTVELKPASFYYMPLNIGKIAIDKEVELDSEEADELEREALKSGAMPSGRFLFDDDIIYAQDKSEEHKYLPAYKGYYLTSEEFEAMHDEMCEIIKGVALSITSGDATAVPLKDDKFFSLCDTCESKALCRRRK